MANTSSNPFARYAYSPTVSNPTDSNTPDSSQQLVVFSGGDLQAYVNNIKVGNLESVTWSISVEVVGNYVMGRRDAVLYTTGKRVVVGSIVLSQYDRHALLEQVFQISARGLTTVGSMWDQQIDAGLGVSLNAGTGLVVPGSTLSGVGSLVDPLKNPTGINLQGNNSLSRGLNTTAFNQQLKQQIEETAAAIGNQKFSYSDQLPPFDLTLVGVTKSGQAARCSIFGLQITQETAGFSQNDLGNSVGMSFVALAVSPWRPVDLSPGASLFGLTS